MKQHVYVDINNLVGGFFLTEPAEPKKEKLDDKNGVGPSKRAVSPNLFETDSRYASFLLVDGN